MAHKVYEVTLPEYHEESKIVEMLRCAGVKKDDITIKTIQIILNPLTVESSMAESSIESSMAESSM